MRVLLLIDIAKYIIISSKMIKFIYFMRTAHASFKTDMSNNVPVYIDIVWEIDRCTENNVVA